MIASVLVSLSILTQAAAPQPQTQPPAERPGSDLTRSLNSGPPSSVLGTVPAASAPARFPAAPSAAVEPEETPEQGVEEAVEAEVETEDRPAPPAAHAMDATAIADLPFRIDVPRGFSLTAQRPAPGVGIYSIKRGDRTFVMIYAGPASQFPIYSGEARTAAGRTSIVSANGDVRTAMEHLFQRQTAPAEIHVWLSSLEGEDLALAERIGNSVEPK
ncbi:hypothetical protein E4M02_08910 [Brevundimonas sp. S30B]|uniref:hypothetical protein n=1 Tax=unclassified Brevundimonas TaxID=2622653 RepID=UPI00107170D0|nr:MULTISPECIES: hypothetical protein [unclassified Brevundimonas]QBX38473.1 hypothetical protein E4M01_12345 [Brevundimonas sp. MF30-B]TFW02182.1 hypothetical protein E4M02_08910 [Brevundimonas sp. S30B]